MNVTPLETLYETTGGVDVSLPSVLNAFYGRLNLPKQKGRPYVISNFVTTLDGVVSLNAPGHSAGADISGFNEQDRIVMGLLRAVADTVIVGAGTLRSVPDHLWTAEYIYPDLAYIYKEVRTATGKSGPPLNVIVTASGKIDLRLRVFASGEVPVLIVTTTEAAERIHEQQLPSSVQIVAVQDDGPLSARAILDAVNRVRPAEVILLEGGPKLMGNFFAERCLHELFLTVAPQIAGRDVSVIRPGLVAGKMFAPEQPLWGTLAGVKRGGSHLFLRYTFDVTKSS
jgi:riboflavin biosynthesis pyrimidine reductase